MKSVWDDLPKAVILKSWDKIFNWDDDEYDEKDNIPLSNFVSEVDHYREAVEESLQLLSNLTPSYVPSCEEIDNWNAHIFDDIDVIESLSIGEEELVNQVVSHVS